MKAQKCQQNEQEIESIRTAYNKMIVKYRIESACRVLDYIRAAKIYVEPPVDWTKVPVDTPILVRDYEGDTWRKRYFARYEDNKVCAWANGCTSWNADGTACWIFAKLAEREE